MASVRLVRGWTQLDLALRLGVHRGTVAKWEAGSEPVPKNARAAVAAALGVESEHVRQQWPMAPPLRGLKVPPLYSPDYPVTGTLEEMLNLGSFAATLWNKLPDNPALAFELRERFPRDSAWELLAAVHLILAGAELEFRSMNDLFCSRLVTEKEGFAPAGHFLRHVLRWQLPGATILLCPQVSLCVVGQSRSRRPDFLVLYIGPHNLWIDVEIDSKFHEQTANDDARRAVGLGLPYRRYPTSALLRSDFPSRLLKDMQYLHDNWTY